MNEDKKDVAIIEVGNITDIRALHALLKNELCFPDFYGMNWDAFWDAITGLVELPKSIIFTGWYSFEATFPKDAKIMMKMFSGMKEIFPNMQCEIKYT